VELPKSIKAEEKPIHGQAFSTTITLPPLATLWFEAAAVKPVS
jgi:hypothetical protein